MATPIEVIAGAIRSAISGSVSDSRGEFDAISKDAGANADAALQSGLFGGGLSLDDILLLIPGVGELLTLPGLTFKAIFDKAGRFVLGVATGWALGEFASEALRPVWLEITHAINDALQSEVFDVQTAAQLNAQGVIGEQFARSEAAGDNWSGDHLDFMTDGLQSRPDVGLLLDMLNRGLVQESDVDTALQRHTFPSFWWDKLKATRRVLLSPADLALATLRGVMTTADATSYAATLGVDPDDLNTLIENTGEPPGLMQLLEAYRRGFINQDTLERGIRQSRVRDEWIPTVEALRYEPMSVADAVRAVVENYLPDADGQTIAEQNGLTPEHWPLLVESWGRPLAIGEMGSLVHRGLATEDDFKQAVRESDIKDKYVDKAFALQERLLPERLIVSAIHYGAIDLQTGASMLLELGYSQQSASILLKLGLAEAHGTSHQLTRAQIGQLYADAIITRTDALSKIEALGFSATDAGYMLTLIDVQSQLKEQRAETSVIRANYLANAVTTQQATTELNNIGITGVAATHLINVWDNEKRRASRNLSEAQIVKAAKEQTITGQQALTDLTAIGYARNDATILLTSNGVTLT